MNIKRTIAFLMMTSALTACSLAPDFHLPDTAPPAAYKEAADDNGSWKVGAPAANQPRGEWWRIFNDDTLNQLEANAAQQNLSIQASIARVRQARAIAAAAQSSLFPSVDGTGSFSREKLSPIALFLPAGTNVKPESIYSANIGLSYELDLFGANLNTTRAALAEANSAQETLLSAVLTMQADVASLYFNLRMLDAETDLLTQTLKLRQDSLDILQKRLDAGTITELDTSEATVDLETTRTQLQTVTQQRREMEHALALLLGQAPANFKLDPAPLAQDIPAVPPGMPSALLERRPDIAAGQHVLAAANARIGIAKAAFFPSVSLTANGGGEGEKLGDVFQWSNRTWAFGPLVSLPIFHGGELVAEKKRTQAVYAEAVANYRQQVLVAFKDVEDSLSRLSTFAQQSDSQRVSEKAARRAEELATVRYDSGEIGYLEAITAKRDALDVERAGLELQGNRLIETVQLIRALGGGWDGPMAAEPAPAKPPTPVPVNAAPTAPVTPTAPGASGQNNPPSAIPSPVLSSPVTPSFDPALLSTPPADDATDASKPETPKHDQ